MSYGKKQDGKTEKIMLSHDNGTKHEVLDPPLTVTIILLIEAMALNKFLFGSVLRVGSFYPGQLIKVGIELIREPAFVQYTARKLLF